MYLCGRGAPARTSASALPYPDIPADDTCGLTSAVLNSPGAFVTQYCLACVAGAQGMFPIRMWEIGSEYAAPELYFGIAGATIRLLQSLLEVLYV